MTPSISCSSNRMDEAFWRRLGKCILVMVPRGEKVKAKVRQAVRDQIGGLVVDVSTERMAGPRGHLEEELESAGGGNRGSPPAVSSAALVPVLFTHLKTSRPVVDEMIVAASDVKIHGRQDEILGHSKLDPHKPITARGQAEQRTGTRTQKGWASPWAK
ncbi:hypothetical protein GE21DRAFT_1260043 [Neurospora crassa]|nr:hypothetical protein GE21DRAFT_1260043 [Neurospora crassa]